MNQKYDLDKFKSCKIIVIGDVMLDRYLWGEVKRISPEAPVPIFQIRKRSEVIGGAGNVVRNLVGLGVSATLIGIRGNDNTGETLLGMFENQKIDSVLIKDCSRPTITKTRIISNGQQLLRIDEEDTVILEGSVKDDLLEYFGRKISECDVAILSDYGKGILQTPGIAKEIITMTANRGIPVFVDPKGTDWERYRNATCITPNTAEIELVVGEKLGDDEALVRAAKKIQKDYQIEHVLVTRGPLGMCLCESSGEIHFISSIAREVYDVSGAGDTVISTLTTGFASGLSLLDSARIANVAAGIVVGKIGTQPINILELKAAIEINNGTTGGRINHKINSLASAEVRVQAWKADNQKVVFTNGCFDLLHPGHIHLLHSAKELGDKLIVGINSDESIQRLKGPTRPILSESDRAAILGALDCVDMIVIFAEDTPVGLIQTLAPDVLVKGSDYNRETVVGGEIVEGYGGKVNLVPVLEGYSTTLLAEKMLRRAESPALPV